MQTIHMDDLAIVCGGMHLDPREVSDNIDDRRGLTPWQSMHVKRPPVPPLPPLVRHPGDLSSQAGLDDIALIPRHRRR